MLAVRPSLQSLEENQLLRLLQLLETSCQWCSIYKSLSDSDLGFIITLPPLTLILLLLFFLLKIIGGVFFYFAALGLNCHMWDLPSIIQDLSLQRTDSQLWHAGTGAHGFRSCDLWASLLRGVWDLSSPTKNQTCVPCIDRQILNL